MNKENNFKVWILNKRKLNYLELKNKGPRKEFLKNIKLRQKLLEICFVTEITKRF